MGVFGLVRRVLGRAKEPALLYKEAGGQVEFVGFGNFVQEVAGESHYQAALEKIAGPKTDANADYRTVAHLVPEPKNKFDRNAIRVEIDGVKVGYIPKEDTGLFNVVLKGRRRGADQWRLGSRQARPGNVRRRARRRLRGHGRPR